MKIAYSGIEGAFAHIATKRIFNGEELVSFSDFRSAYEAVENGMCNYAVLPIENSYAGEVAQVTDLMFQGNLFLNGVYSLNVIQNLLGTDGTELKDIKNVISHPQALEQCADFIRAHGYKTTEVLNTARAAKQVAELNDKTTAAIASRETAEIYGLKILAEGINEKEDNTTRFAILSRDGKMRFSENENTVVIMFTVKNEAGALVKVLNKLGEFGFNMSVIRSRPLKGLAWRYYFYIEAEGKYGTPEWEQMILEMKYRCDKLKVLGRF
ncbi:prephenate dehydratase [Treponema sp.]|uniref:prephenate dehydratase n=1 Tax=Treponema sp. TaxID=166 RepID=UPI00298DB3C6|nr:prephenate dehydratase domain-containing protein [Treponema sp.]